MGQTAQLLVIDDDPNGRFLTVRRIKRTFPTVNVLEAEHATAALELMKSTPIDLLLTDHGIGPFDGFTLIRELRSRNFAKPIIMASMNPALEREALAAGANAFVFTGDGNELDRLVRTYLPDGANT